VCLLRLLSLLLLSMLHQILQQLLPRDKFECRIPKQLHSTLKCVGVAPQHSTMGTSLLL